MRIVYVTHYALPHIGGIEFVVHHVAAELGRRGHIVTVVASDAGGRPAWPPRQRTDDAGYRLVRVRAVNLLERRFGVPYPLFSPRLARVLDRELAGVNVVHVHGWLYMGSAIALALAARRAGTVRVLTEHVGHVDYASRRLDAAERWAEATLGRLTVGLADAVVAYNPKVRAELAALAPGRAIHAIHNGVDIDRFRPASPEERARLRAELGWDGRPRILFAGRPVPKKGFDIAMAVAQRLGDEAVFAVAGPRSLPQDVPAGTELLGPLPIERLAEIYRACDAIVMPSRGEGFPLTALEAMASGLPLVMTDDPAYREVLDGADDGVRLGASRGGAHRHCGARSDRRS